MVASTAMGIPRAIGKPVTTTSICLPSLGSIFGTEVSRKNTLSLTRPPASLKMRAQIFSTGVERNLIRPDIPQDAARSPYTSKFRLQPLQQIPRDKEERGQTNRIKQMLEYIH